VETPFEETPNFNWRVIQAVRGALSRLSTMEREVVERFHFCGESSAEIGTILKIPELRASCILGAAQRKLKRMLGSFVQKHYGIPVKTEKCPICRSENREDIEKLLKTKTKEETWKRILRKLRTEFQVCISARNLSRHWEEHPPHRREKAGGSTA
ncbi:MAG TPA: sigma factor-like helix-turn-helix DNA-binding protein, partial [candidate division Zixibacteria bacterium]|nr:sigma factor-like helix-turn-helix DNA-binding protein [candidate division Zixibacteria bacterium]